MRELREGARRPMNHRLRMLSAAVGMVVLGGMAADANQTGARAGANLLAGLHTALLGLILLVVPASAAECISRERREGTLGLLFLTPLSAGGIVAGKAVVQGLRALTLWLTLVPLLTLPFLTGGTSWADALSALSLEFCATVLCLGAGLLASSLARERNGAFVLAFGFGALFLLLFSQGTMLSLIFHWRGASGLQGWTNWGVQATGTLFSGFISVRTAGSWSALAASSKRLWQDWLTFCWLGPILACLALWLIGLFAARRIERAWQDRASSPRRERFRRRLCTPLFRLSFRRAMQRQLDRNPIAWLQVYSWKARLSKWLLLLSFILIGWMALALFEKEFASALVVLLMVLGVFYVFAGVNGFLEDKRSGALEMVLITPLSAAELIFGRTYGLWKQFLPAGLVLAAFALDLPHGFDRRSDFSTLSPIACGFFALPVFATYFALRVKNLVLAGALTSVAVFVPSGFAWGLSQFLFEPDSLQVVFLVIPASYGMFALLTCALLRHSLSRRIYAF